MCDILCLLINLKLNSQKQKPGEQYGFSFPVANAQLGEGKFGDAEWFTKALRAGGTISQNTSVSKLEVESFLNNGLLSDIGCVRLEYENGDGSEPKEAIIKFPPVEFITRVTTDLFKLARTEYLLYKQGGKRMPFSRIPKLYYGDMNYKTGNYCLIMEKINDQFYNILSNPSKDGKTLVKQPMNVEQAKMCIKQLAKFHATFPDDVVRKDKELSFFPRSSDKLYKIFQVEASKHWKAGVKDNKPNKIVHPGWTYKIPQTFHDCADDIMKNFTNALVYAAEGNPEMTGLTHGDTRIDNWFFYKNDAGEDDVGILDFQLMLMQGQPSDVAWLLTCSCTKEMLAEHEDMLLDEYLQAYEVASGKAVDRAMWMEEYSLSYVGVLGKHIIGAGGIKVGENGEMVVGTMNWLLDLAFDGWERRNTAHAWAKFRAGTLMAQKKYKGKQYEIKAMKYTDELLKKYPRVSSGKEGTEGIELTSAGK